MRAITECRFKQSIMAQSIMALNSFCNPLWFVGLLYVLTKDDFDEIMEAYPILAEYIKETAFKRVLAVTGRRPLIKGAPSKMTLDSFRRTFEKTTLKATYMLFFSMWKDIRAVDDDQRQ